MTRTVPHRRTIRVAAVVTVVAGWLAVLGMLGVSVGGALHLTFQGHVLCPVDGQLHHVQPSDDLDGAVEESRRAAEDGGRPLELGRAHRLAVAHSDGHEHGHRGGPSQPHRHDEAPCELGVLTHGTPLVAGSMGLVQAPAADAAPLVAARAVAHAPVSLQHLSPSHSPPA